MKKKRVMKRAKITTIEGLAVAMQEGFESIHVELRDIKEQLRDADKRISALEMKLGGLYKLWEEEKLQRLDINYLLTRITRLEQKVFEGA